MCRCQGGRYGQTENSKKERVVIDMAENNKNKKNTRAGGTAGTLRNSQKSSSNKKGRSGKKDNKPGDTSKYALVLVIAGIAITLLVILQNRGENSGNTAISPSAAAGISPTAAETSVTPTAPAKTEDKITPTQAPSTAPTKSEPEPTKAAAVTVTATPTPGLTSAVVSREDADASIRQLVDTTRYQIELVSEQLRVEGNEYYQYCIRENETALTPYLVVDKVSGGIWCYDALGTLSECHKFPLDNTGNTGQSQGGNARITPDQAYAILCTYSKEKLGLSKEAAEYTPEYDSTVTLIQGMDCYRFNLTEMAGGKIRNRGEFYISVDGTKCFGIDNDLGEFIPIQ